MSNQPTRDQLNLKMSNRKHSHTLHYRSYHFGQIIIRTFYRTFSRKFLKQKFRGKSDKKAYVMCYCKSTCMSF